FRDGFSTQCLIVRGVTQPPQDRPPEAADATDADAVAFRSTSNSSAMIVSIPASAWMRPAHQLARAQHQLAGRDVGAPDPLLISAAVERRLRRAVQRGKITGGSHILGRSGHPLLNSAPVERRLRRAVQRGKITGGSHILGRSGMSSALADATTS